MVVNEHEMPREDIAPSKLRQSAFPIASAGSAATAVSMNRVEVQFQGAERAGWPLAARSERCSNSLLRARLNQMTWQLSITNRDSCGLETRLGRRRN